MEEKNSSNQFKIKNLDTGEYYDIDEAVQKFNVMELRFLSPNFNFVFDHLILSV
jgi:hypothetical protein